MIKRTLFAVFQMCWLVAFPTLSHGASYYVSPTGAGLWSQCTNIATPCSWQTAMTNAAADDTVLFRGGIYSLGTFGNHPSMNYTRMYPANSGSAGHPITFRSYPGEVPVITGTVVASSQEAWFGCGSGEFRRSYITWDGFAGTIILNNVDPVRHYETTVFRTGGDYCTIKNSNFTGIDVGSWNYNVSFIRVENSDYAVIENNYLHGLTSRPQDSTAVNTAGIWIFNSDHTTIRNNTIENCHGGIYGKVSPRTSEIYDNFIHNASNECYRGIYINCQTAGQCQDHVVRQNVIVGCNQGLNFVPQATTSGWLVYNNTIYQGLGSDGAVHVTGVAAGLEIFNNVVASRTPYVRISPSVVGVLDYNIFYGASVNSWCVDYSSTDTSLTAWSTRTGFDAHSYLENPQFIAAGGNNPWDYRINANHRDYGRGGSYPISIGAYVKDSQNIGYCPEPRNLK